LTLDSIPSGDSHRELVHEVNDPGDEVKEVAGRGFPLNKPLATRIKAYMGLGPLYWRTRG